MNKNRVTAIAFVSVYVDDLQKNYQFYSEQLGLEKAFDMGEHGCGFKVGEKFGLYLEGGNKKPEQLNEHTVRASFVLYVPSASAMFSKLKAAGVKFVHEEPEKMGEHDYWFQFYDPAGNLIEILGDK